MSQKVFKVGRGVRWVNFLDEYQGHHNGLMPLRAPSTNFLLGRGYKWRDRGISGTSGTQGPSGISGISGTAGPSGVSETSRTTPFDSIINLMINGQL